MYIGPGIQFGTGISITSATQGAPSTVDYIVVAGGGGGASSTGASQGSGGLGGGGAGSGGSGSYTGGTGGSGVVILAYPNNFNYPVVTGSPTIVNTAGQYIITWTGTSGSISF